MKKKCAEACQQTLRVKANGTSWPVGGEKAFNFLLKFWACASVAGQKDCGLVVLFALPRNGHERKEASLLT
ncbi:MAG TPA: hypothetical protein VIQ77_10245 [Mucilaginibacter sp.]|jgi:hypothetical protein